MSGSTVLVLVMLVAIVGLLALAAATFLPQLSLPSLRQRDAGPKHMTNLAERLSPYAVTRPTVVDLTEAEQPRKAATRKKAAPARKKAAARKA